jgi:Zn-dependent protease
MDNMALAAFQIIVLVFSVTIHELSHGLAANSLGDDTAKVLGRLTLNPLKHLDLFGSFILPVSLALLNLPAFGYAKPVPYNPLNLSDRRWGPAKVAIAGPLSNLALALMFGLILRFFPGIFPPGILPDLFSLIIFINLILAVFNLFPVPPLDGHWILFSLLPSSFNRLKDIIYKNSLVLFILFILFGMNIVYGVVVILYNLIVGGAA